MQEESKLSNIVQENIELKKQNQDLKSIIQQLGAIKDIHQTLIEKSRKAMNNVGKLREQIKAQDNMIKDLVGQIQ